MKQVGEVVIEIPTGVTVERIAISSSDGSTGGVIAYQAISDGYYQYGGRLIVDSITITITMMGLEFKVDANIKLAKKQGGKKQ